MSDEINWVCKKRDYETELKFSKLSNGRKVRNGDDPLIGSIIHMEEDEEGDIEEDNVGGGVKSSYNPLAVDNLTTTTQRLSSTSISTNTKEKVEDYSSLSFPSDYFNSIVNADPSLTLNNELNWAHFSASILSIYQTSDAITINKSSPSSSSSETGRVDGHSTTAGIRSPNAKKTNEQTKIASRLAELEDEDETLKSLKLTQQEYRTHIQELGDKIKSSWSSGDRLKGLVWARQAAVMMDTVVVPRFYPSKFVLVVDVLDTLGSLVSSRLKELYTKDKDAYGHPISAQRKAEMTRETAMNWLFKITGVRGLVSRLYLQLALIRAHKYLSDDSIDLSLKRIVASIAGISDPLIAGYLRLYLMKVIGDLAGGSHGFASSKKPSEPLIISTLALLSNWSVAMSRDRIDPSPLTWDDYLDVLSPVLRWNFRLIALQPRLPKILPILIETYTSSCFHSLILNALLRALPEPILASSADGWLKLIKDSTYCAASPPSSLYSALGSLLCRSAPPSTSGTRLALLNTAWKAVTKFEDQSEYMKVAETWIIYPTLYCSTSDTNVFLGDVVKHARRHPDYTQLLPSLLKIAQSILSVYTNLTSLLCLDHFAQLIDLFQGETKLALAKSILSAWVERGDATSDPGIMSVLLELGRTLHNSFDSLSIADEIRQISVLLSGFIRKINFGFDYSAQLSFYMQCRKFFSNTPLVVAETVYLVSGLSVRALAKAGSRRSASTMDFVRTCSAFCFVTIPSLPLPMTRLSLYLSCAQSSLMANALPQTDSFLKAAITEFSTLVPNVSASKSNSPSTPAGHISHGGLWSSTVDEAAIVDWTKRLISFLTLVPGHPKHGALYLFHGLVNSVQNFPWSSGISGTKSCLSIYFALLAGLCTMTQSKLPQRIHGVQSNDQLYSVSIEYQEELTDFINGLLDELLSQLASLPKGSKDHSMASLQLLDLLLTHCDLSASTTISPLVLKLVKIISTGDKSIANGPWFKSTLNLLKRETESTQLGTKIIEIDIKRLY